MLELRAALIVALVGYFFLFYVLPRKHLWKNELVFFLCLSSMKTHYELKGGRGGQNLYVWNISQLKSFSAYL